MTDPERMSDELFRVVDTATGKAPDLEAIALKEKWAQDLTFCDMEGFAVAEDGSLIILDECGNYRYCIPDRFEVVWNGGKR